MAIGNLGFYGLITTLAKRVGGPKVLALLVATSGFAVGRGAEAAVRATVKGVRAARRKNRDRPSSDAGKIFTVATEACVGNGVELREGDRFRVLANDGDATLIELLGDTNNPYFVSGQALESISEFTTTPVSKGE